PSRRWFAEDTAAVLRELHARHGANAVLLGAAADAPFALATLRAIDGGVRDLVGRTTLRQLLAVLARARLAFGPDSGALHLAAANDPGAASGVLAPPSCGVPSGTPRRSSLRLPLSLPGSFASLIKATRTDSLRPGRRRGGAAGSTPRRGSIRPPAWRPRRET